MKTCSICHQEKCELEFNFRSLKTQVRYKHCKICQAQSRKDSYEKNKDYYLNKANESYPEVKDKRLQLRKFINDFKTNKPCADCGESYPHYVMDCDHLPEFKKEFKIAKEGKYLSKERLLAELAKCEAVCSNCHRKRTWERLQSKNGG